MTTPQERMQAISLAMEILVLLYHAARTNDETERRMYYHSAVGDIRYPDTIRAAVMALNPTDRDFINKVILRCYAKKHLSFVIDQIESLATVFEFVLQNVELPNKGV